MTIVNKLAGLSIQHKLMILTFLSIMLVAAIGITGYAAMMTARATIEDVSDVYVPSIDGLVQMKYANRAIQRAATRVYVIRVENTEKLPEELSKLVSDWRAAYADFEKGRELYEPLRQVADETILWNRFVDMWKTQKALTDQLLVITENLSHGRSASEQVELFGAFDKFYPIAEQHVAELDDMLDRLVAINIRGSVQGKSRTGKALEDSTNIMIVVSAAGACSLVLIGLAITASVIEPLTQIQNTMAAVEHSGDLSLRARIVRTGDVSKTAVSLNAMLAALEARERVRS